MSLVSLSGPAERLENPLIVLAFDGWIDAGSASTAAAEQLAEGSEEIATLDGDALFDYRARRPTLEIEDGRPAGLSWPELALRRQRIGRRDVLILSGPEPDYRWRQLARDLVAVCLQLGVTEWISLGAIPAAVPHTRPVPVLGTQARAGLLRGDVQPGPAGILRVPSAAVSMLDLAATEAKVPALGYYAQVPHYVSGEYPEAALALLAAVAPHLDGAPPLGSLEEDARRLRERLDLATTSDDTTRSYVERLETMVDEARLPSGDELISDIERFLRDRSGEGGQRA